MVKPSFPNRKKLVNVTDMNNEIPQSANNCVPEDSEAKLQGDNAGETATIPGAAPGKTLSPEAVRALMEAEARRQAAPVAALPAEINGRREGEEPTRYGDWEKKGLAVDF